MSIAEEEVSATDREKRVGDAQNAQAVVLQRDPGLLSERNRPPGRGLRNRLPAEKGVAEKHDAGMQAAMAQVPVQAQVPVRAQAPDQPAAPVPVLSANVARGKATLANQLDKDIASIRCSRNQHRQRVLILDIVAAV
ncbi:MAG UNVERIFIED_CONTAM: hypothetical protein LVR18_02715 [Planctomycetaceae bacterium]|jgi:hypothetical protein